MRKALLIIWGINCLLIQNIEAQNIVINEVMSSNVNTLFDQFNEAPDWIELYNSGNEVVNLLNFGLSDDLEEPFKWIFPEIILTPASFLIIFASDKDIRDLPIIWSILIDQGDEWHYIVPNEELPANWKNIGYNDNLWNIGNSGFGYGDNDDETLLDACISVYLRKEITITNINNIAQAILHIDFDDAFVAYLNGTEIARFNIGTTGILPTFNEVSNNSDHEAAMYNGGKPDRFEIPSNLLNFVEGENILAIQVHNAGLGSSDLTAIPFFTIGRTASNGENESIPEILDIKTNYLHTNFKLKSTGESILLTSPENELIDQKQIEPLIEDVSFGRKPDGTNQWMYFYKPTPGGSNITSGYSSIQQFTLQFSIEAGLYKNSIQVEITGAPDNATIYYSTDGSDPTRSSKVYINPINISVTTVLKARIITNDDIIGEVVTNTYIINKITNLPIISLSTNPDNLWDFDSGIYVMGPNAEPGNPYFGANFWQDWEKPVHFEYFETDGKVKLSVNAGMKIYGAWSRAHDQKSLTIYARSKYGAGSLNYPFFKAKPIDQFEAIVLRNSGNDWMYSMIRDAFMVTLIEGVDHQAYQPAVVYLNGEYWGILNIREKINEHFIASNNNIDPDQIELLENNINPIHGDGMHYNNMINYIRENDLSINENYKTIKQQMDVNEYMKYMITEIYCNNTDWPGNNIKYWRPDMPGGRWRWIIFDTDFGFGLYGPDFGYSENTLAFALEPYGPGWPNPPWSTELFRNLVKNESFKIEFINLFADHLNTTFDPNNLNKRIDEYEDMLNSEMKYHFERWSHDIYRWYGNIEVMRNYSDNRISYMRDFISEVFNLNGTYQLNLNITPQDGGKILVNSIIPESYSWRGYYFKNIPIQVIAIPNPGYKFIGWEGYNDNNSIIQKAFLSSTNLTAKFEEDNNETLYNIVINEINYNSVSFFDSDDWIELYNSGSYAVDLSGWLFKDGNDNHIFQIPNNTYLLPKKYLIISRNYNAFRQYFPEIEGIIGDFAFGLSNNGDTVRLYDSNNNLVDFVAYDINLPWPILANGTGASIELINPVLDNNKGENWTNSEDYGTPGHSNDPSLVIDELIAQKIEYKIYPNPFSQFTTISFYLNKKNYVKIDLYNIQGKLLNKLDEGIYETGNYSIPLEADENFILPGIYLIKLQIGDQVSTSKVLYKK